MVAWQHIDVSVNGINIHCHRSGTRAGTEGPPLILLHGITDSGQCWPLVSEALSSAYEIIAVDARGHGKSDKPESGYSREDHATDVAELITALGLSRPAVMGHSMGAGTASVLAAMFPELVGVLVLEDPPWRERSDAAPPHIHAGEWEKQILERKKLTPEELRAQGEADNPSWREAVFAPWIEAKYDVSPNVVKFITESDLSWAGVVPKIQCPTLLVTADPELGAIVTPDVAAQVREANNRIQVVRIAGAGHNIRRERSDAYLDAVKAFLAAEYSTN